MSWNEIEAKKNHPDTSEAEILIVRLAKYIGEEELASQQQRLVLVDQRAHALAVLACSHTPTHTSRGATMHT